MAKKAIVTDAPYSHPDFHGLSEGSRVLYTWLLIEADAEGRVPIDPSWIKQRVFAWYPTLSVTRVGQRLDPLLARGLIEVCSPPRSHVEHDLKYGQITNFKENNPRKGRHKGREGKVIEGNNPPNPPTGGGSEESEIEEIVFELHGIVGGAERDILRAVKRVGHTLADVNVWREFLLSWGKQNSQFTHPGRACRAEVLGNKLPENSTLSLNGDGPDLEDMIKKINLGGDT